MPASIQIVLTDEEDRTLSELRVATTVPQRTRDRAHMLRLNAQGWTVPAIAEIFECHEHTVRATVRRWQDKGLGGLWEALGRGAKPKWQEADLQTVEQWIEQDARTYNSHQLAQKLSEQRQVKLSPRRLRHLLQKRALDGNELVTATEASKTLSKNNSNKPTSIH
jgi:transposase